jgi:hypothetical protein
MNDTTRLLLFVEDGVPVERSLYRTLSLARELAARVIAVSIIDEDGAPAGTDRERYMSDLEEAAWKRLYEVEEEAFGREIKVSLLLEQGDELDRLVELCERYEVHTLLLDAMSRLPTGELVARAACEVELVGTPHRRPELDSAPQGARRPMEEE